MLTGVKNKYREKIFTDALSLMRYFIVHCLGENPFIIIVYYTYQKVFQAEAELFDRNFDLLDLLLKLVFVDLIGLSHY